MKDLWPQDIGENRTRSPQTIIEEQALLLSEKTGGVVEGRVERSLSPWLPRERTVYLTFTVEGVFIENATFLLAEIHHGPTLYPVTLDLDREIKDEVAPDLEAGEPLKVSNEEELIETLRKIFHSERTRLVIQAILARTTEEGEEG